MHRKKEKSVIHFIMVLILIVFITQRVNGRATNDVMTQQEVKCTPNNQCKCTVSNEKWGEVKNFPSNEYAIIPI